MDGGFQTDADESATFPFVIPSAAEGICSAPNPSTKLAGGCGHPSRGVRKIGP